MNIYDIITIINFTKISTMYLQVSSEDEDDSNKEENVHLVMTGVDTLKLDDHNNLQDDNSNSNNKYIEVNTFNIQMTFVLIVDQLLVCLPSIKGLLIIFSHKISIGQSSVSNTKPTQFNPILPKVVVGTFLTNDAWADCS